jgi:tripartite ATP-independent transporter DctP family solute receptor
MPLTHHLHRGAEAIAKYFNEHNKKYQISVFGAGQLYTEKALVQGVSTGAVEMSFTTPAFWSGTAPSVSVIDYPFLLNSYPRAKAAFAGQTGKAISAEIEKSGVKVVGWLHFGLNETIVNTQRPLVKLEDFKGLRLRSPNPMGASMLKAVGAGAVVMSATEVYLAMQRGTLDGTITGSTAVIQRKMYEVAKYATIFPLQYSAHPVTVNRRFWNRLTPDEQKTLEKAVAEASDYTIKNAEAEANKAIAEFRKLMTVNDLEPAVLAELDKIAEKAATDYLKEIGGDASLKVLAMAREDIKNAK